MPGEHSLLSVLPAPLPSPRYSGQRHSQEPDWRVPKQRARLVRRLPSRSAGEAGAQRPRCWRCLGSAASQGSLGTRAGQGPHERTLLSFKWGRGREKERERESGGNRGKSEQGEAAAGRERRERCLRRGCTGTQRRRRGESTGAPSQKPPQTRIYFTF